MSHDGAPEGLAADADWPEDAVITAADRGRLRAMLRDPTDQPEDISAQFRRLAHDVWAADGDDAALAVMRERTGLSFTDPAADRAELDRRVAECGDG